MRKSIWPIAVVAIAALPVGAAFSTESSITAEQLAKAGFEAGYLTPQNVPDSLLLSPAPPAPGSGAEARDVEAANAALTLQRGPRWTQATIDAEIFGPSSTSVMACAAGFAIGPTETPAIQKLLRRAATDLGMSTRPTKQKYARPRPFTVNGKPSCTPDFEPMLRKDGSYPSGHSAVGYGWGLILAEIVPSRAAQIVARGRAYGDSRRVCNVHWLSDVEEGRIVSAAVVARLHADPVFQKDLKKAKAEAKKATAANAKKPDCTLETQALGS